MILYGTVDFNTNQAKNLVFHNLPSSPANPLNGQTYYNTTTAHLMLYNGASWNDLSDHNDSLGLQGGTTSQYYHLTSVEYSDLTTGTNTTKHYHSSDRDLANATGTLGIGNGGTGQITQQTALNALAGGVTSGQFLRGNDTNVVLSAIQNSDLPLTTINSQAGNYTLALTDYQNKIIEMTSASANTVTIPLNSSVAFPIGTTITIVQLGAGITTVQGTAGVTVNGVSAGSKATTGQYQGIALYKRATDTWIILNK